MRRREFLRAGALGLPAMAAARQPAGAEKSCILLMLVGGPSHLDTWDMKPEAPREIRGPFRPIRTNAPGVEISEIFPRMARHADKFALIRSVHGGGALHDTGHQLMQTGRVFEEGREFPHLGAVVAQALGSRNGMPANVVLPGPIGQTGGNLPHGQSAGFLGAEFEPHFAGAESFGLAAEPEAVRVRYGLNPFGQSCLNARRLVEAGVRVVTVNMFDTVFGATTWDSHGYAPFSTVADYREHVGPMFDVAYTALLEDLSERGLLENTLVVGMGEFGRTPKINPAGGRDHWPGCWTIHMAGGGVCGGQVYGSSDRFGFEPKDDPVSPGDVVATVYRAMGAPVDLEALGLGGARVLERLLRV